MSKLTIAWQEFFRSTHTDRLPELQQRRLQQAFYAGAFSSLDIDVDAETMRQEILEYWTAAGTPYQEALPG